MGALRGVRRHGCHAGRIGAGRPRDLIREQVQTGRAPVQLSALNLRSVLAVLGVHGMVSSEPRFVALAVASLLALASISSGKARSCSSSPPSPPRWLGSALCRRRLGRGGADHDHRPWPGPRLRACRAVPRPELRTDVAYLSASRTAAFFSSWPSAWSCPPSPSGPLWLVLESLHRSPLAAGWRFYLRAGGEPAPASSPPCGVTRRLAPSVQNRPIKRR